LAALSNRVYDFKNVRFTLPVGPLRCLAIGTFNALARDLVPFEIIGNFLLPVLSSARSRMEQLEVVNHEKFNAVLLVHAAGFSAELQDVPTSPVQMGGRKRYAPGPA
jgi:hypothetical protein